MYCTLLYWDLIMILIIVPLLVILCIQCVGVLCLHLQLQWAHNPMSSNIVLFIWLLCSKRLSEWVSELREENEWIKWMNECSMCVCQLLWLVFMILVNKQILAFICCMLSGMNWMKGHFDTHTTSYLSTTTV